MCVRPGCVRPGCVLRSAVLKILENMFEKINLKMATALT